MPKFNLKGEGMESESPESGEPKPVLHETEEQKGPGPLLQVVIAVVILALLTLLLHFFGVIKLWGPDETGVASLPEPVVVPQEQLPDTTAVMKTPTPAPVPKPKLPVISSSGDFTVQVSSWQSQWKADEEVARLTAANLDAFVEEGSVDGDTWHRVRVGRYATRQEAEEAASRLSDLLENGAWVAKVRR